MVKTKYDYECDFEELMDKALNELSSDDFSGFKDSISMMLCDYVDEYDKAQLSQEGTTKDATPSTACSTNSTACSTTGTISRQQAVDAVDAIGHIATMPDGDKCIRRSAVKYTLSMLPSATFLLFVRSRYER